MVSLELLVVLAPAIASAFAGFCVEVVPRLRSAYRRFMSKRGLGTLLS